MFKFIKRRAGMIKYYLVLGLLKVVVNSILRKGIGSWTARSLIVNEVDVILQKKAYKQQKIKTKIIIESIPKLDE